MGAAAFKVPTEFTAVDKFTSVVNKMASGVSSFVKTSIAGVGKINKKVDSMFSSLDRVSQLALGLGAAGLFTLAVGGVKDYETALHSLEAVTGESYTKFEGQIESLADKNKKSAIDVAGSFETIGSAMSQYLDNPKALGDITQAGITLAKASRQELTPTLENLTSVMNQFKLGAEDADKVINQLTAGEIVGSVSTAKVAEGLQEFGANAYSANVKLSESVALIETLGKQMDKSKIAVGARNILGVLASAKGLPKEALTSLKKHGVSTKILMDKTLPLGVRLKELSKIQKDAVAVTKIFGKENMTAANVIFQNLDSYNQWEEQITKTNKAEEQAATNSDTLATKIDELKSSFLNTVISSDQSNVSLGIMKEVMQWLIDNMGTVVGTVGLLAAGYVAMKAAVLGAAIWTFVSSIALGVQNAALKRSIFYVEGNTVAKAADTAMTWLMTTSMGAAAVAAWSLAAGLFAVMWPVMAVIAAVLALVYIFLYWDEICAWFGKQWENFTNWIGELWDKVVEYFKNFDLKTFFMDIGQAIVNFLLFPLKGVLKLLTYMPGKLGPLAQKGLDAVNKYTDLSSYADGGKSKADAVAAKGAGKSPGDAEKSSELLVNVKNEPKKIDSPEATTAKQARDNRVKGKVDIVVKDPGKNLESVTPSSDGNIPVKTTSTVGSENF